MNLSRFALLEGTEIIGNLPETITSAIDRLPPRLIDLAYASFEGWVEASWDDFEAIAGNKDPEGLLGAKAYYYNQRIHMVPLGYEHSRQNDIPYKISTLFAAFNQVQSIECINATLGKAGCKECQPDLSIYLGKIDHLPASENNQIIDLNQCDPPTLAVKIVVSSLANDLGPRRSLYQELVIQEYWVIDGSKRSLIAFDLSGETAQAITQSVVLPGLDLAIVTEALGRSDEGYEAAITMWLIEIFQK
ncbi:MAG: Uma2 family endonuclease [Cyanophyceae cyanobacterium]